MLIKGSVDPSNSGQWHSAKRNGPWYLVVGDTERLRHDDNHLVEVKGTLDTRNSVVGTSASETAGPSGTIHATAIKTVSGRCGE